MKVFARASNKSTNLLFSTTGVSTRKNWIQTELQIPKDLSSFSVLYEATASFSFSTNIFGNYRLL